MSDFSEQTFDVKESKSVGFDSKWVVKKVTLEEAAQTNAISHADSSIGTTQTSESEVQTDADPGCTVAYDEERLAAWLTSLYPKLKPHLEAHSASISNYRPSDDNDSFECKLVKVIRNIEVESGDNVRSVSSLSWNCTGNTLAVAFEHSHSSWCHHNTKLLFFTYDRNNEMPDDPQKYIPIDNCVTNVKFHPFLPSIIAVGTYTGELSIWNIQNDDQDCLIIKLVAHDENITQITWTNDISATKSLILVTSSLDGFISMWNFNLVAKQLAVKERFKIKAAMFGRNQRKGALPPELAKKIDRGVLCFDFNRFTPDMFVVAAEGGIVAQCSLIGARVVTEPKGGDATASDPVFKYYQSNEGETTNIVFSPNRRDMFLTNSTDGEIRIFLLGQDEPAQTIFMERPLSYVNWVPYHEKLLIGCDRLENIIILDMIKRVPLKHAFRNDVKCQLVHCDINQKATTQIAAGCGDGCVQLWSVPWNSINL